MLHDQRLDGGSAPCIQLDGIDIVRAGIDVKIHWPCGQQHGGRGDHEAGVPRQEDVIARPQAHGFQCGKEGDTATGEEEGGRGEEIVIKFILKVQGKRNSDISFF